MSDMDSELRHTDNAKIKSTMLGVEDHGILTFYLFIEGKGWGQGCGGFSLDGPADSEFANERTGFAPGLIAIRKILETVGVTRWENLPGTLIRVRHGGPGSGRTPIIGNIIEDRWFDLATFMKEADADA